MRSDMARVLVCTHKQGARKNGKARRIRNQDVIALRRSPPSEDCEPIGRLPMRPVKGYPKEPGENLTPLWRYLFSRVGRPWDATYSEIRRVCSPNGTVAAHIYQHLYQFVRMDVTVVDGVPYIMRTLRNYGDTELANLIPITSNHGVGSFNAFYVDQKGFLRQSPYKSRKHRPGASPALIQRRGWVQDRSPVSPNTRPRVWVHRTDPLTGTVVWFRLEAHGDGYSSALLYLRKKGFDLKDSESYTLHTVLGSATYFRLIPENPPESA
jgi:hypothetical protein